MVRTKITPPEAKDLVLATLAAASGQSPTGLDPNAKFVLCDVCDRLITFVVFRTSITAVDLCNVCRAELEMTATTRKDFNEPLRITKAGGGVATFAADDAIQFVGPVPKLSAAAMKSMKLLAAIDDDEVHPSAAALKQRLNRQTTVKGGRVSRINAAEKSSRPTAALDCPSLTQAEVALSQAAPNAAPLQSKRPRASSRQSLKSDDEAAPARRGRLPRQKGPRTESAEQTPENPQPTRRALLSRRSSPVMESAVSLEHEQTPQPAPPSLEKENTTRSTVKAKVTQAASAAAASNAAKALFADEDDMPFFLSQATLTAVAEASSQPVTATRIAQSTPPPPPKGPSSDSLGSEEVAVAPTPVTVETPVTPVKAPRIARRDVSPEEYEARVSSGSVVNLFAGIASIVSSTEARPTSERPTRVTVQGDGSPTIVGEGSAVPWRNAFVGVSRPIIMAAICPTVDAYGVWLSFACGGDQASIDMWHAAPTSGALDTPKRMYSVSLGSGVVVGLSWVPVSLARPDNDTLGVCTVLRQKLLLTCKLPRRGVPSSTVHVQIAGAQQIRVEGVTTNPVSLQWHTTHQSVAETHLFVAFECWSIAIYQPIGGGPNSKKLNLALIVTVAPPARRPASLPTVLDAQMWWRRTPPIAVGVYPAAGNTNTVHLAIGARDALAVMQGPGFELSNFCKVQGTEGGGGHESIGAIAATSKGFLLATEAAVHHYHARRGEHKQMSTAACAAAQIVALREVSPSLLVCANAAGQVVQATLRSNGLEMKSILWVERRLDANGPVISLRSAFDGCQAVPPAQAVTPVRYAFHPLNTTQFGGFVVAYFPDGAWVLLPVAGEGK
jgi:hypothetical protein